MIPFPEDRCCSHHLGCKGPGACSCQITIPWVQAIALKSQEGLLAGCLQHGEGSFCTDLSGNQILTCREAGHLQQGHAAPHPGPAASGADHQACKGPVKQAGSVYADTAYQACSDSLHAAGPAGNPLHQAVALVGNQYGPDELGLEARFHVTCLAAAAEAGAPAEEPAAAAVHATDWADATNLAFAVQLECHSRQPRQYWLA